MSQSEAIRLYNKRNTHVLSVWKHHDGSLSIVRPDFPGTDDGDFVQVGVSDNLWNHVKDEEDNDDDRYMEWYDHLTVGNFNLVAKDLSDFKPHVFGLFCVWLNRHHMNEANGFITKLSRLMKRM